ncbi:MAG: hypothetical protein D6824_02735, partial [Planctomycetota bacterium]
MGALWAALGALASTAAAQIDVATLPDPVVVTLEMPTDLLFHDLCWSSQRVANRELTAATALQQIVDPAAVYVLELPQLPQSWGELKQQLKRQRKLNGVLRCLNGESLVLDKELQRRFAQDYERNVEEALVDIVEMIRTRRPGVKLSIAGFAPVSRKGGGMAYAELASKLDFVAADLDPKIERKLARKREKLVRKGLSLQEQLEAQRKLLRKLGLDEGAMVAIQYGGQWVVAADHPIDALPVPDPQQAQDAAALWSQAAQQEQQGQASPRDEPPAVADPAVSAGPDPAGGAATPPAPQGQPQPEPTPEPQPQPQPAPAPQPAPEPQPEPAPAPQPDPQPAPEPFSATFLNPPVSYTRGSGLSLTLQILSGAPADATVVFGTTLPATGQVVAVFTDPAAPYVYPASMLDTVPLGQAEVVAMVMDAAGAVLGDVTHPMAFVAPPPEPQPAPDPLPDPTPAPTGTILQPGSGFTGPTAQPAAVGDPTAWAADAKAIARWDVVPWQTFSGQFQVGVVAFHVNGIDRVDFSLEGGPWVSVSAPTVNPRTGVKEYWATLDATTVPDGLVEVRAIVWPTTGVPRVLAGSIVDDVEKTGEHSMFLYANGGGTLPRNVRYVSLTGSDAAAGTQSAPFRTIMQGVRSLLEAGSMGGTIVLLDAGEYDIGRLWHPHSSMPNDSWITITPRQGLTRDQVVLKPTSRTDVRPRANRLRFRNLSMDFANIVRYYPEGTQEVWFDHVRWFNSDGWTQTYGGTYFTPVRTLEDQRYYATDSVAENMIYGFTEATLLRGCHVQNISGDAYQNSRFIVKCTADNVNDNILPHHTDLFQYFGTFKNVIIYDIVGTNLNSIQTFFFGPVMPTWPGDEELRDFAIVDVDASDGVKLTNNVTQLQGPETHMLWRNVNLPWQEFAIRDGRDGFAGSIHQFKGHDVLIENSVLHPLSVARYITFDTTLVSPAKVGPVGGVRFVNVTAAP